MNILVDLRMSLPYVRDQGLNQGLQTACLAFATSDAHTHSRGDSALLSAGYLYSRARTRIPQPKLMESTGLTLDAVSKTLELDGQPLEDDYPSTTVEDKSFALPSSTQLFKKPVDVGPHQLDNVFKFIESGRPTILCLDICRSFYSPEKETHLIQGTAGQPIISHAVLGVGIGELNEDRYLLVRNSWGARWGDTGHAWVAATYLKVRLWQLAVIGLSS